MNPMHYSLRVTPFTYGPGVVTEPEPVQVIYFTLNLTFTCGKLWIRRLSSVLQHRSSAHTRSIISDTESVTDIESRRKSSSNKALRKYTLEKNLLHAGK